MINSLLLQTIREVFVPLLVCQATPEASEALKFCAQTLDMVSAKRFLFTQCGKIQCLKYFIGLQNLNA